MVIWHLAAFVSVRHRHFKVVPRILIDQCCARHRDRTAVAGWRLDGRERGAGGNGRPNPGSLRQLSEHDAAAWTFAVARLVRGTALWTLPLQGDTRQSEVERIRPVDAPRLRGQSGSDADPVRV